MSRVIAVVEGQTEQTFVRDVLAPWLGYRGVIMSARLVGKPGHKGGIGSFGRARNDIVSLLKQEPDIYVTTMFDFYAMPESWPGRTRARSLVHKNKAAEIEKGIHKHICEEFDDTFDENRLIPYIQMHEFEALLFSEPGALSFVMRDAAAEEELQKIKSAFSTPEKINDNPATAPSKRIEGIFNNYRKPFHGRLAATRITVEVMCDECPHFKNWVESLRSLGTEIANG